MLSATAAVKRGGGEEGVEMGWGIERKMRGKQRQCVTVSACGNAELPFETTDNVAGESREREHFREALIAQEEPDRALNHSVKSRSL